MRIAVYPGSFDPITMGHIDIIKRASVMFDKLIICVMANAKKTPVCTPEERVELIKRATAGIENIEVTSYGGLLADFARQQGAGFIVRGLRALSDFEYEFQMALTNRKLSPEVETIFMMPQEEYSYVTASMVREIAHYAGDVSPFVPPAVMPHVRAYIARLKERPAR